MSEIIRPQLDIQDQMASLTRDVADDHSVQIDIYYKGKDHVYSEELDLAGRLQRKYDFSCSLEGEYLFHFTYDDRTLSEYMDINGPF